MATSIGEAIIKLKFDTKELDKSQKEAAGKIDAFLGKVGTSAKIGGKLVAGGIAAAATQVAALGTVSVKTYAEYEQLQGGVETLFKDSADDVMAYAEQSYKTTQLSAAKYMETATSFSASLIQGLGGDTAKAAEYADRAIVSMSDNANKMGTDIESIQSAYAGFAKQNYTMLDNLKLGYGGTKTEMERLIADASQMTDSMEKLGVSVDKDSMSFDNIVNAIAVVQDNLGIAGASAQEAGTTISGSFMSMKAAARDLVTGLTNPDANIDTLIDNFVNSIDGFADNLEPAIDQVLNGITKLIEKGVPKLLDKLPELIERSLPGILDAAVQLFNKIIEYTPQLTQTIITLFGDLALAIIPQLPTLLGGIIKGIIGVVTTLTQPENLHLMLEIGLQLFMAIVNAIPQVAIALLESLPELIANVIAFLIDPNTILLIIDAAVQLFMGLVKAVPQILSALFKAFGELFGKLWEKCTTLFKDFAGKFGDTIGSVFKGAINGVLAFIEGFINGPIDIVNLFIDGINGVIGVISGGTVSLSKITRIQLPRLAEGGIAKSSTLAEIGEAGAEAVIPLERNTDNWAGLLARTLADEFENQGLGGAGGITVYMTNQINNNLDADEIGRRIMTGMRRAA